MRLVAVVILLVGLATMPVAPAANECIDPCKTIVVPAGPATGAGTTYYLYSQALTCHPSDRYCQGQPAPRFTAFLYEEANDCSGLQRYGDLKECKFKADRVVLL